MLYFGHGYGLWLHPVFLCTRTLTDITDMALLLYHRTCAAVACSCTTFHYDFDLFPRVWEDYNPVLLRVVIWKCNETLSVDQDGPSTVLKRKTGKALRSDHNLVNLLHNFDTWNRSNLAVAVKILRRRFMCYSKTPSVSERYTVSVIDEDEFGASMEW